MEGKEEINKLIAEKHNLLRKLETKYSQKDKEIDEERIGEIELEILKLTTKEIEDILDGIPEAVKDYEIKSIKDIRKLRKLKRNVYKEMAKRTYNLYMKLVAKKKIGVVLEYKLKDKNIEKYDIKEIAKEVRKY